MPYWAYLSNPKYSNRSVDARRQRVFNINQMMGRVFWLDAERQTYTDVAGSIAAGNGDAIARWNDVSGMSNDCFNIVASKRPTLIDNGLNNKKTVRFTGSSSQYLIANNQGNFNWETPTVVFVGKRISGQGDFFGKGDGNKTDARHRKISIVPFSGGTNFSWWAGTDAMSGCSANVTTANWNIYIIRCYRNSLTVFDVNGVQTRQTTTVNNTSLNEVQFTVGCGFSHGAEFINGEIAELMIFNRILNNWEVGKIETYLSGKWNIAVA